MQKIHPSRLRVVPLQMGEDICELEWFKPKYLNFGYFIQQNWIFIPSNLRKKNSQAPWANFLEPQKVKKSAKKTPPRIRDLPLQMGGSMKFRSTPFSSLDSVHFPTRRQVPPVLKSIFIFRTLTPNHEKRGFFFHEKKNFHYVFFREIKIF